MNRILSIFVILISSLLLSCKKDNYKAPDASLSGKIVDATTGALVPQQTLNGAKIQLFQTSYSNAQAINSSVHPDGSYSNSFIFSGDYKIIAVGPFVYADTIQTTINGATTQDIKVHPYLDVTCAVVSKTSTSITLKVNIKRNAQDGPPINRVGVVAGITNSVDYFSFYTNGTDNGKGFVNIGGDVPEEVVVAQDYVFTLSDLRPGTNFYVRGCARTSNAGGFYNYAPMLEVMTDK